LFGSSPAAGSNLPICANPQTDTISRNFLSSSRAKLGRWLRGTEFHFPERPENLPSLKPLENWPKFNPRNVR
jgi:hypothetical protein